MHRTLGINITFRHEGAPRYVTHALFTIQIVAMAISDWRPAIGPILHCMSLIAAVLSGCGYNR